MTDHSVESLHEDSRPRPRHKGLYILPSLFTAVNIAAGYYAISQAILGTAGDPWHFDQAAKAIGFAILFDGLDGRIARLTNTVSSFGRELDSLADVITFGIAPAILAWLWGFRSLPVMDDSDLRSKVIQLDHEFTQWEPLKKTVIRTGLPMGGSMERAAEFKTIPQGTEVNVVLEWDLGMIGAFFDEDKLRHMMEKSFDQTAAKWKARAEKD